ncbi:MAG TPA: hypothetical protein VH370_06975, partial [Humisphaera sp.]|nr:hypothetical protein [Humisphaera sp.]
QGSTKGLTYVTVNPQAWQPIQSYEGVGFRLNTVGVLSGKYDGIADNSPGDYKVQINWGDSSQWTSGFVVADPNKATGFAMVLLGSHVYNKTGDFPIVVNVTGPDGITVAAQTCGCDVSALPGNVTGTQPPIATGDKPETEVTVNPQAVTPIETVVGKIISGDPVAVVGGSYDGTSDTSAGDYHAYIDFGDGSQWVAGQVVNESLDGFQIAVLGSHTYSKAGDYAIVVVITGPDGETVARQTCGCDVQN